MVRHERGDVLFSRCDDAPGASLPTTAEALRALLWPSGRAMPKSSRRRAARRIAYRARSHG